MTEVAPLPKTYDPAGTEARWQQAWQAAGAFHPAPSAPGEACSGEPFAIVIPPPNVTGSLHMGHGFETALIDTIVRFQRLLGKNVLCLPGTDHASIAVQTILEKQLKAEGGSKDDLGRDAFLERAWTWKAESGGTIVGQLRRLGYSVDWQRERFTLDPGLSAAVAEAFVRLHEQGLIYRGEYLVNWCPASGSAVSDLEVEMTEMEGHLWHFRYPLSDGSGHLVVATTRPETMLGDTGVAVFPGDERYAALVGKTIRLPLVGRDIPIVADEHVDPAFGTGCVKVTPAHDPNDYEAGLRNHLEMINILTPNGHINENGGPYKGLERFTARKRVVEDLEARGLMEKSEPYETDVGHSDRSRTPIEPYLSEQWFVRMAALTEKAMEAVRDERVKFHPERYARTYLDWLSQKRDWCISRQLWWGHQIPIWSQDLELPAGAAPAPVAGQEMDEQTLAAFNRTIRGGDFFGEYLKGAGRYVLRTEPHPENPGRIRTHFCPADENPELQNRLEAAGWKRDGDVLDTWFSSALWPFSTLGWPDETPDLETFYPTDVLVTAREIITLWVARMVMMGLYNLGMVPFADVYIHAMIQDGDGRPMKKSLGNGVDPLDIIATHGTDALRFTLAWMTTETQDVRLPVVKDAATGRNTSPKFDMGRNFCNKLWNATRFALMNLEGAEGAAFDRSKMRLEDRWILSRVERIRRTVDQELGAFHFQASLTALYDFFWHDLCDWYLEVVKPRLTDPAERAVPQRILAHVLDRTLRLMHPFVPFITESAWEGLNATVRDRSLPGLAAAPPSERLILARWPEPAEGLIDETAEKEFGLRQELIEGVRKAKAESGQSASEVAVYIPEPAGQEKFIAATFEAFADLAAVTEVHIGERPPAGQVCASSYVASLGGSVYVPMPEEMIKKERARMAKEIEEKNRLLKSIEGKLANKQFTDRAPAEVVERERARVEEARAAIAALDKRRAELG